MDARGASGRLPPLDEGGPRPIRENDALTDFQCGHASLDDWLRRVALRNEVSGASRTYVVTVAGRVIAYYCLATGGVTHAVATSRVRRNAPDPVPVVLIGRLAVDRQYHRQGIGAGLLKDAVLRTRSAARHVGIRALLVHAIDEDAVRFYEHYGFRSSPVDPTTLMVALSDIERSD